MAAVRGCAALPAKRTFLPAIPALPLTVRPDRLKDCGAASASAMALPMLPSHHFSCSGIGVDAVTGWSSEPITGAARLLAETMTAALSLENT